MKRKNSDTPSAIWSFGAGEPAKGLDLMRDQLGGALWYWNALTHIEMDRRVAVKQAEANIPEAEVEQARKIKSDANKATKTATPVERKAIHERTRAALAAMPSQEPIRKINAQANARTIDARAGARLHFGTYLLVEKAMQAAARTPEGPSIKRWLQNSGIMRGGRAEMAEGRLGAHIMKGCSVDDLRKNTMLQIEMPEMERTEDGREWDAKRGDRRKGARTLARIRAGSDGRKPIWVEFPITLHRPLPADARIKAAWLACRYVGTQWKYELQIQIESSTFAASKPIGVGTAAIDLCWRRRDGGIRIGYICDKTGVHREILMPEDVLLDLNAAYDLKGKADLVFDTNRDALVDDFGSLTLPGHVDRKFTALRLWKSAQRFAAAVIWWRDNRFVGDSRAFEAARAGLERWRHLYQYYAGVQRKALRRRKHYYQDFALRICQRYATVVLGDFDMRDCVELDKAAGDAPKSARHNRVAASPSEFRNVVKASGRKFGTTVLIEKCNDATRSCSACGHVHELDPFVADFRCDGCGVPWDRGHNHCSNLLKRASGSVPPRTAVPLAPMFPQVSAIHPTKRKIRDRAGARRSKQEGQSGERKDEKMGAVENLAQEVGT